MKHSKPITIGNKLELVLPGDQKVIFVAGSQSLVHHDRGTDDLLFLNGEVEFADGSQHWAVIGISPEDGGEHWFTGIFTEDGGFTAQEDPDFLERLGKTKEQVFGYKYRYFPVGIVRDHHVNYETGWSQ